MWGRWEGSYLASIYIYIYIYMCVNSISSLQVCFIFTFVCFLFASLFITVLWGGGGGVSDRFLPLLRLFKGVIKVPF